MPIHCTLYCRSFKGVDAGSVGRFLTTTLSLALDSGARPVWVNKQRCDRAAKVRFMDCVDSTSLTELKAGRLLFQGELIKCDVLPDGAEVDDGEEQVAKRQKKESTIEDMCLPWHGMAYADQLVAKKQVVIDALAAGLAGARKGAAGRGYTPLPEWSELVVDDTLCTPEINGYRNKCEFTIGRNVDGEVDIGFMFARATHTSEPVVAAGEHLMHVSSQLAKIVESIRSLVRGSVDTYPLFSHLTKTGCWRMASVRACPLSGQSQVILQTGVLGAESPQFETLITEWANKHAGILTSVYVQYNGSVTDTVVLSDLHEMKLLAGPESIEMRIGNIVNLRVHPLSFFQTNTQACELLYSRVFDLCAIRPNENVTVFDVCCGVGSIGLFIAAKCAEVNASVAIVGVDMVEEAIANARVNAEKNGLEKACRYVAGRAEVVLPDLIKSAGNDETIGRSRIICVVDPPRVGLHKSVIQAIRENEEIKSLIYVSCNPRSMGEDLAKFCEPLTSCPEEEGVAVNARFAPKSAVAVDMFPNTIHCEVVVLLKRQ